MIFTGDADGTRYHQAPSQTDDFYFVDLGTRTLVFDILGGPGTPAADKADLEAMVASVRIN